MGTSTGHILHGCLLSVPEKEKEDGCPLSVPEKAKVCVIEPFNCLLELELGKPVLDIKIVYVNKFVAVLAVNDTNLYQLAGEGTIVKEILLKYQQDPDLKARDCFLTNMPPPVKRHPFDMSKKGQEEGASS